MGAGYRTAKSEYVDQKMLQLPYELMANTIQSKDKGVNDSLDSISALEKEFKLNALQEDSSQAKELMQGYEDRGDELSRKILENPVEYQRQLASVRQLSRDFGKDMYNGKWAAIDSRYNGYVASAKRLQDLEGEGYSDEYKQKLLAKELSNAGKLEYDAATGNYNKYRQENTTEMKPMNNFLKEALEDVAPDGSEIIQNHETGGWDIRTGDKTESISEEDLSRIISDTFDGDPELMAAVKQRGQLNVSGYEGTLDENGNIAKFTGVNYIDALDPATGKVITDDEGNTYKVPQVAFSENFLGKASRAAVEKYGFTNTSNSRILKRTDKWKMDYKESLTRSRKKEEENVNEEQIRITQKGILTAMTGSTYTEFGSERQRTSSVLSATREEAASKMKEVLNGQIMTKDQQTAIAQGNFDALRILGVPELTVNELQSEHDRAEIQYNMLTAADNTWKAKELTAYKKVPGQENTEANDKGFVEYLNNNREINFNEFLDKNSNIPVDVNYSWGITGMSDKAIKSVTGHFADSFRMIPGIDWPGLNGRTLNEGIQSGDVKVELVKVPVQKAQNDTDRQLILEYNNLITNYDPYDPEQAQRLQVLQQSPTIKNQGKTEYTVEQNGKLLNFSIDANSLIPANSLSDDGELNLGVMYTMNGKSAMAKVPTSSFSSSSIDEMKAVNNNSMKITKFLDAHKELNNFKIPKTDGIMNFEQNTIIFGDQQVPIFNKNNQLTPEARGVITELILKNI